jgi:HlyD family secretion protein
VFAIENDRTRLLPVAVGHRGTSEVEVINGLNEGARVILHPANDLKNGARVMTRATEIR